MAVPSTNYFEWYDLLEILFVEQQGQVEKETTTVCDKGWKPETIYQRLLNPHEYFVKGIHKLGVLLRYL